MVFTAAQTSSVEDRNTEENIGQIWERVITFTIDAGDGSAKLTQALNINGRITKIIAKSGAAAGITGTFTLSIDDNGNNEIFTASGPAEGATSTFNVSEDVSGTIDVGINPNDDPTSGSWEIVITLRGI